MNIKKLEAIKTALAKILEIEQVKMSNATAEAGQILSWNNDTYLPEVGEVVYVEDGTPAPAGEYILINEIGERVKITIGEDGVVTESEVIYEDEVVEEVIEETIEEEVVEAAEEDEQEAPTEDPEVTVVEEVTEDIVKVKDAEIEALKAEIEALKAENEELKAKIEELEAEPQAEPVEEQFEAIQKKQKTSGAVKYAQALKH